MYRQESSCLRSQFWSQSDIRYSPNLYLKQCKLQSYNSWHDHCEQQCSYMNTLSELSSKKNTRRQTSQKKNRRTMRLFFIRNCANEKHISKAVFEQKRSFRKNAWWKCASYSCKITLMIKRRVQQDQVVCTVAWCFSSRLRQWYNSRTIFSTALNKFKSIDWRIQARRHENIERIRSRILLQKRRLQKIKKPTDKVGSSVGCVSVAHAFVYSAEAVCCMSATSPT